jgi:hypothetical protein
MGAGSPWSTAIDVVVVDAMGAGSPWSTAIDVAVVDAIGAGSPWSTAIDVVDLTASASTVGASVSSVAISAMAIPARAINPTAMADKRTRLDFLSISTPFLSHVGEFELHGTMRTVNAALLV